MIRALIRSKSAVTTGSPPGAGRHAHRSPQPLSMFTAEPAVVSPGTHLLSFSPAANRRLLRKLSFYHCFGAPLLRKLSFSHCFGSRFRWLRCTASLPFSENSAFYRLLPNAIQFAIFILQVSFCNSLLSTLVYFCLPLSTLVYPIPLFMAVPCNRLP